LSMLREIFYGPENKELVEHERLIDAEPREIFIIACLLIPIIGIGFYPKLLTQIYDATTIQLTSRIRESVPALVQAPTESSPRVAQMVTTSKPAPALP
jgi:NAD(P)H-quinone oxidoreductase subunit 4